MVTLMPTLPSGTVTLLFTDIEGSTRLLQDMGEEYEQLLMDHRRILSDRFENHMGVVVDTQGDAFFVAFQRAQDAVAAAVEAQRALAEHEWPGGRAPRVRMAIHTGEPTHVGEGFVGLPVHRAARICAAGHGGQILLSSTTREVVRDLLPQGVIAIELGEHRLKDLDRPEVIAQLVVEGVQPVLTPLKSLESQPAEATPFAGREEELAKAAEVAVGSEPQDHAPLHARLAAETRAKALDWRRFVRVPGRRRLANRIFGLGLSLHASARIATGEDVEAELLNLGKALVVGARDDRGAIELLGREDRRTLERRLAKYREATFWDHNLQAADRLVDQIAALTALADAQSAFEAEFRKLESKIRSMRGRVFDARRDAAKQHALTLEVEPLRQKFEHLAAELHRAYQSAVVASTSAS